MKVSPLAIERIEVGLAVVLLIGLALVVLSPIGSGLGIAGFIIAVSAVIALIITMVIEHRQLHPKSSSPR